MDITERLSALAAAPKPFAYVIRYDDGFERRIGTLSRAAAENGAVAYRRKIGKPLIRRETGETVRIVSVDVVEN